MRLPEQRLWDTFKRHAPRSLGAERVENLVSAGWPDVYCLGSGAWVELKAPPARARESTRVLGAEGLRPDQINWIIRAVSKGRRVYILLRDSAGRLALLPGAGAEELNAMSWEELSTRTIASDWATIMEELS